MLQALTTILILAQGALAINGIIGEPFAGINLAASDDEACATAVAFYNGCVAQPQFTAAPVASQAKCLCCNGASNIVSEYASCKTYAQTALPTETILYSNLAGLSSICSVASVATLCGGGGVVASTTRPLASPTITSARTSSGTRATITGSPSACSSLDSMVLSCSRATPGFVSLDPTEWASCFCTNNAGSFTTAFDSFASGCASYLKTATPTDYSSILPLVTFCAQQGSGSGSGGSATTASQSVASPRPSGTTTVTDTNAGTGTGTGGAVSTSVRSAPAAPGAVPGPVAWVARVATFVLSFFFLA